MLGDRVETKDPTSLNLGELTGCGAARAQMVKRGGLEEMCSLLMLVAQEEEQRLALEPGYQGISADGEEPVELDDEQRSGPSQRDG